MNLLVIEPRALFPPDAGAKILSGNILRHLARLHEITILVNDAPTADLEPMRALCRELITVPWRDIPNFTPRFYAELARCLLARELYAVKKFCTPALKAQAAQLAASRRFDLVICDTLSAFMPRVDFARVPSIALAHNVEHLLRRRQSERARFPKSLYLRYYARKTEKFERAAFAAASRVVTVSPADADYIRTALLCEHVSPLPPGVDTDYFRPSDAEPMEPRLVFTGSMDWQANQDAVMFFVRDVLPAVKAAHPAVRLTVVGRRPPSRIRALAHQDPAHVEVTGTVADVRPYLARAQLAVVPVLFGSGIKIKVLEAMAMGKPVVVTRIGAEGLPLVHGRDVWIADTAADMAHACVALLGDPALRRTLAAHARTAAEHYDWRAVAAELARICEHVAARRNHDGRV